MLWHTTWQWNKYKSSRFFGKLFPINITIVLSRHTSLRFVACSPFLSLSIEEYLQVSIHFHCSIIKMRILNTLFTIGFTVGVGFATAVLSNTGLIQERDGNCTDGPGWALPVYTVGGSGGTFHCKTSYGQDYSPVSGMEVWRKGDKNGDRISGTHVRTSFIEFPATIDTA